MYDLEDTIVAIASARGGSLRGIVRASGPDAMAIMQKSFSMLEDEHEFSSAISFATDAKIELSLWKEDVRSVSGELLVWPKQQSYTKQPSFEFHTVGSTPLLESVVDRIAQSGARLAQPGEFTMRAFLAGRMDLAQAEAVLGVIDASSLEQAELAMQQLAGGLTRPLHDIRQSLIELLADIEAGLDFVEDDIEFIDDSAIRSSLQLAENTVAQILEQIESRDQLMGAPRVVICGRPNVGKSRLFNRLSNGDTAIVADQSGTTRDYLESQIQIHGQSLLLIDTAGMSDPTSDDGTGVDAAIASIDQLSEFSAKDQRRSAHLELFCVDGSKLPDLWEQEQIEQPGPNRLVVITKADCPTAFAPPAHAHSISSVSGHGIDSLQDSILRSLADLTGENAALIGTTSARCRESLNEAKSSLSRALEANETEMGQEFVAFEIREALNGLGLVLGTIYTDDILDQVFQRFCIGK